MDLNIVLVAPEIPQNTGTIGRLCVCLDVRLHLVRPLGFSLARSQVRRAGLDYWQHVDLHVHEDWASFLRTTEAQPERLHFASTKGVRPYHDVPFRAGDYLVFGRETSGLPESYHRRYGDRFCTIPMPGRHARSLNLANAVAVVVYEAYRQFAVGR